MSQKILITGGAGFLGIHLCERLIAQNHEVICVDNFFSGSMQNIEHLLDNENFKLIHHDVTIPLPQQTDIDEIYNLACPASPKYYQQNPIATLKTNVLGAINMLELAKEQNCKILQASTSEIYGDPEQHPQIEYYRGNVNHLGERGCYDEGKRCAETLFIDYKKQHNITIKIIRIFNTYGPRMQPHDGRVISNFIMQALQNQPISIYGSGYQTRCFCYVDELINGAIRMMNSRDDFTGPVNIGNPEEITMLNLAKIIIELTASKSEIVFKSLPQDDPARRQPNISLAAKELDWNPQITLETGLIKTITYFDKLLSQHKG